MPNETRSGDGQLNASDLSRSREFLPHKSIELGISVLQSLATGGPRGVRELSRQLDASKSTVHRILSAFELHQFVQFDEITNRYSVGPGLLTLVANYRSTDPLLYAATPSLESLSTATGETVELSILTGAHRMTIFQLASRSDLRYATGVGRLAPLHAGSTGRVLLSLLSEDELDRHIERMSFDALTKNTVTDPVEFRAKVISARDENGAASWEEGIEGVAGCSVPIKHPLAGIAAIGVYGPTARFTTEKVSEYFALLHEAARDVEQRLDELKSTGNGVVQRSSRFERAADQSPLDEMSAAERR
jgi:DNA-binding IclR family transcriptional regulator